MTLFAKAVDVFHNFFQSRWLETGIFTLCCKLLEQRKCDQSSYHRQSLLADTFWCLLKTPAAWRELFDCDTPSSGVEFYVAMERYGRNSGLFVNCSSVIILLGDISSVMIHYNVTSVQWRHNVITMVSDYATRYYKETPQQKLISESVLPAQ